MIRADGIVPIRRFHMGPWLVGRGYVIAGCLVDGLMISRTTLALVRSYLRRGG